MMLQLPAQRVVPALRGGNPQSAIRNPPAPRAFTIIEVLVAIMVLGLILTSLYGTWQIIVRSTDRALKVTVDAQRARMATRVIEEAFGGAMLFQANAPLYAFMADTSGQFSAVSFAANLSESFPGGGYFGAERLRRVTFLVEDGAEGPELRLYQNSLLAPPDADVATIPIVLARNVSAFQLEFWDTRQGEYVTEWLLTNQLPQMVRITVGFGVANNRYEQRPMEVVTRTALISSTTVPAGITGTMGGGGGNPGGLLPGGGTPAGNPGGTPPPVPPPGGGGGRGRSN